MADNCIYFLSAVSDYCMVCFFRKVFLKIWHSGCIKERYIYISMSNNCIFIDIYNLYFCKMMWLSAISPDVFGTSKRNAPMYTEIFLYKYALYSTKHICIVEHAVLGVASDEDHQRLVIHFYLYLCFLWLLSLAGKMTGFFCNLVVT